MIRTLLYDTAAAHQSHGGQELLDTWRGNQNAILWIDLWDIPRDEESELMKQYFGIHPLAIQDAQRDRHPPKYESFSDHTFVLLKGLDAGTQDLEFGIIQIAIFAAEQRTKARA